MKIKKVLIDYINNILFPKYNCLLCDKELVNLHKIHNSRIYHEHKNNNIIKKINSLSTICTECKENLKVPLSSYCQYCHKQLKHTQSVDRVCTNCNLKQERYFVFNRSSVLYNDFIKEKIALYKYRGKESLIKAFSKLLQITYDEYYTKLNIDIITFVPLHHARLQERGFNQAEQMAGLLSKTTGKPIMDFLIRVKNTDKQSKHNRYQRLSQIKGSFQINQAYLSQLKNKNILLVDDIYTSGATVAECARELKSVGANSIYVLTLARAIEKN